MLLGYKWIDLDETVYDNRHNLSRSLLAALEGIIEDGIGSIRIDGDIYDFAKEESAINDGDDCWIIFSLRINDIPTNFYYKVEGYYYSYQGFFYRTPLEFIRVERATKTVEYWKEV